ncbi:PQQ-binding-like beta-propeller repeat protein [Telmatocola sphagniphila]|jgi:outer membrane protein assembly factor BamB|uniref:PQQ-binding-like beta-propeller repeat protein n=1 Tax=Telmatocola sphagniphila TaxID=1123043 RepID=A0A8E6B2F8_9BACT|nr:PQQ-binding-like beta-propeller repeat protein [Telmatocola sphagniphila]QVL30870.1 PQQ-binding-like beta-propeller repeat protein [Telmatocola sphagniphila]
MRSILLFLGLFCLAPSAHGDDWPQWLGPTRDGISQETIAPWKEVPKVLWKAPVGDGHSSPVVAHGKVFLFSMALQDGKQHEQLQVFDAKKGDLLETASYPKDKYESIFGNGPRATPAVFDNTVYTYGNTAVLSAFSADKIQQPLFQNDLLKEYKAKNLTFGISASPLVVENLVVVPVGGAGHGMMAFDRKTGKEAWSALDDPASYAAPVYKHNQIIALTGANAVGLSLKGEVLWKYPFKDLLNESSTTPVVIGDKVVVSSVTAGAVCLEIKETDGKWSAKELWKKPELSCYFSTPIVLSPEHMLMVTGNAIPPKPARLRLVEIATGKTLWEHEKIGKYHASLIKLQDGKVLGVDDNGYLFLIDPTVEKYTELSRSRLFPANGNAWAHPALVHGKLYVRSAKELFCFELK